MDFQISTEQAKQIAGNLLVVEIKKFVADHLDEFKKFKENLEDFNNEIKH